jgi:hypothetical protein
MKHVMEWSNWNVPSMATEKKIRIGYWVRNSLKCRQSENEKLVIECYTEKYSYTITCIEVSRNTGAESIEKIWIYK